MRFWPGGGGKAREKGERRASHREERQGLLAVAQQEALGGDGVAEAPQSLRLGRREKGEEREDERTRRSKTM